MSEVAAARGVIKNPPDPTEDGWATRDGATEPPANVAVRILRALAFAPSLSAGVMTTLSLMRSHR